MAGPNRICKETKIYFAYFDESGDSGFVNSPTRTFTLACILVHDSNWLSALDQTVAFRRYLKDIFKIPTRIELKSSELVHGKGAFRNIGLGYPARMAAYRAAMRFQRKVGLLKTFAVVIAKDKIQKKDTADVREIAWRYAIQRLERFGTSQKDNIMVIPDDGHGLFIKKKIRAMRRVNYVPSAYGDSTLERKATNIVEDPSDRKSTESYFVQLADLNAYAAFRVAFPGGNFDGNVWETLGDARLTEVSRLSGGPNGIVVWP